MTREELEKVRLEVDRDRDHNSKEIKERVLPTDKSQVNFDVDIKEIYYMQMQALLGMNEALLVELRYMNDKGGDEVNNG